VLSTNARKTGSIPQLFVASGLVRARCGIALDCGSSREAAGAAYAGRSALTLCRRDKLGSSNRNGTGFRALIFRDRDEILIQSRDAKSLNRYFPELLEPLGAQLPARCVLDGEIVVAKNDRLEFEELQLRPSSGGVAGEIAFPAKSVIDGIFDLLCEGNRDWRGEPFELRREKLEVFTGGRDGANPSDASNA